MPGLYLLRNPQQVSYDRSDNVQDRGGGYPDNPVGGGTFLADIAIPRTTSSRREEKDPGTVTVTTRVFIIPIAAAPAMQVDDVLHVATGPEAGSYTVQEVQAPAGGRTVQLVTWRLG